MSKVGLHINAWIPGALDYVLRAKPKHIKTLDLNLDALRTIKREVPDSFIVYRKYLDASKQDELLKAPEKGAREFASIVLADLEPASQFVGIAEALNETGLWDQADAYNLFTAEYGRLMRAEGVKTVAYNFSVGNPPLLEHWSHYLDGLRESDYLGLHEYSFPTMQTGESWQCLRYRRVWEVLPEDCRKPILITECGIDRANADGTHSGWRAFCSEEEYLEQLRWYASELEKDDYVLGAHIYQAGSADPRWDSFSVLGCDKIADYIANQRREEPMPDALTTILHDMWKRQGVDISIEDGFFKAAVEQARTNGVYVIPQPSPDGQFTTDRDGYRIAYTSPPMYALLGDWGNVKTGLPF